MDDETIQPGADLRRADPVRGALYMCAAAVTMALVGTTVKWATRDLPPPVVVFFRNLFGLAVLLPWLARPRGIDIRTRRLGLHLLRAGIGICAMFCYFYALSGLRLAEAVVLNFTSPLFIPILARLWLREPLNGRVIGAAVIGFAGVALILRPEAAHVSPPAIAALLSAVFASGALVAVRKLTSTEPTGRIVFYFALGSTILSSFPLAWTWIAPRPGQWLPLMLTGALASLAQFLLSRGYARAPAAVAAVFHYVTVPMAALLGWLLWDERIGWYTAAGAALICLAGIAVSLPRRNRTTVADVDSGPAI